MTDEDEIRDVSYIVFDPPVQCSATDFATIQRTLTTHLREALKKEREDAATDAGHAAALAALSVGATLAQAQNVGVAVRAEVLGRSKQIRIEP